MSRLLKNYESSCSDTKKSYKDDRGLMHVLYISSIERSTDAVVKKYLEEKPTKYLFTLDAFPSIIVESFLLVN